jgi:3-phosphoglycerate kinase
MKLQILKDPKTIKDKIVFLRVDFNEPLVKGKLQDETKLLAVLPTIRFLIRYRCKIILATHLGEPWGKKNVKFSCKYLAKRLNQMLGGNHVKFIETTIGEKTAKAVEKAKPGQIIFLENLRFNKGEENNDKKFAKQLASFAEVYVNDAFSVCHRAHASVSAIRKFLPSYAGFLLEKEVYHLNKIKYPAKPMVVLMGGAKIKTKINLIKKLEGNASKILIGGALANNFFKALGMEVGKSLIDEESIKLAKKLVKNKKIVLPVDAVIDNNGSGKAKLIDEIGKKDIIMDIGPQTIILYSSIIRKAKTIIWNGPMGTFEKPHFRYGTMALGQLIAARSRGLTFGVVGGGETIEALKMTKMKDYVDWVSTGGGAMLSYLGGEKMPGLE